MEIKCITMFDQHAKDDSEDKNSSASVTINRAHLRLSALIFLTSAQQAKASTSF